MNEGSSSNRWWESYLVRYFLPSIAGMLIVKWLALNTGGELEEYFPQFMLADPKDFGTAHLILWLLFGSFYCYLASYPILVFHATRSIDFKKRIGNPERLILNPYLTTLIFAGVAYLSAWKKLYWLAFLITFAYAFVQLFRLYKAYSIQRKFHFKDGFEASLAYAYLQKLSKRRAVMQKEKVIGDAIEDGETTTTENQFQDISESYRHLREHGNTAFIFFLELAFCPIVFVSLQDRSDYLDFGFLMPILLVWVFPAVCVHWLGQHLERRFSLFNE